MCDSNRRDFLKSAAASGVAATFVLSGTRASGRVLGANDRIRITVAGINGRGQAHMQAYSDIENVKVAYLADFDIRLFASRIAALKERAGNSPKCVRDLHEALDDKNLDDVSIAAPNHWHSLLGIWACQAGKDVYVEKPSSHNISRAASWSRPRESTTASFSTARRTALIRIEPKLRRPSVAANMASC